MGRSLLVICRCGIRFIYRKELNKHVSEIHNNNKRPCINRSLGRSGRREKSPGRKRRFDLAD